MMPPTRAPWMEPVPPTTTTIIDSSRASQPTPRLMPVAAVEPISPHMPATKAPSTKMPVKTPFRLIPSAPAISLLSMPARTTAPILVLSCNSHSRTRHHQAEADDDRGGTRGCSRCR